MTGEDLAFLDSSTELQVSSYLIETSFKKTIKFIRTLKKLREKTDRVGDTIRDVMSNCKIDFSEEATLLTDELRSYIGRRIEKKRQAELDGSHGNCHIARGKNRFAEFCAHKPQFPDIEVEPTGTRKRCRHAKTEEDIF
jgi:hypothetical protein